MTWIVVYGLAGCSGSPVTQDQSTKVDQQSYYEGDGVHHYRRCGLFRDGTQEQFFLHCSLKQPSVLEFCDQMANCQ